MKKSFLQPRKYFSPLGKSGAVLALLLLIILLFRTEKAANLANALNLKFLKGSFHIRSYFGEFTEKFQKQANLARELEETKEKNNELETRNNFLESRVSEFQKITAFLEDGRLAGKIGFVVSGPPAFPYETVSVDLGEEDGIKPGFLALAYHSILLGRVERVFKGGSEVKLLTYPGAVTEGWLEEAELNVTLEGIGNSNFRFSVPKNLELKVGEKVLDGTRGGYLLGQIENIKEKSNAPLKEVLVRSPLNLNNLRFVELRE